MKKSNFEHWKEANEQVEELTSGQRACMWIGLIITLCLFGIPFC